MSPVHGFWKYHCPCGKIQRRFCGRPPIADQIPLRRACGIHICRASSFKRYAPVLIFAHKRLCAVLFIGGTKFRVNVILATRGEFGGVTLLYSARWSSPFAPHMGAVFIITKFQTESPAVIKTAKEKDPRRIGTDPKSKVRHLKRISALSPHRPELQRLCKRKFAQSRLLRSACFRYVPTLA